MPVAASVVRVRVMDRTVRYEFLADVYDPESLAGFLLAETMRKIDLYGLEKIQARSYLEGQTCFFLGHDAHLIYHFDNGYQKAQTALEQYYESKREELAIEDMASA